MQPTTYRAVLREDPLERCGEIPPETTQGREVADDATFLRNGGASASRAAHAGERMAAALEKLAAAQTVTAIEEPVKWQREVRRDRSLPGRDRDG